MSEWNSTAVQCTLSCFRSCVFECEVLNIRKSYRWNAEWRIKWRMIIAVIYATFRVAKRKPEKNPGLYGILEPLTSAIAVQRSTNETNLPTRGRSLNWLVINPWKDDDEVLNIWKSYLWTAEWRIRWRMIIAVIYASLQAWIFSGFLFASVKVAYITAMIILHLIAFGGAK